MSPDAFLSSFPALSERLLGLAVNVDLDKDASHRQHLHLQDQFHCSFSAYTSRLVTRQHGSLGADGSLLSNHCSQVPGAKV